MRFCLSYVVYDDMNDGYIFFVGWRVDVVGRFVVFEIDEDFKIIKCG